jgi:hypothetical protein
MPRISLWNPVKRNDFKFIDRIVGEHVYAGGTAFYIHKYLGIATPPADAEPDPTRPVPTELSELFIQDLLFLENRDRIYDKDIYELRGVYQIQDNEAYNLSQFGIFLNNDNLLINFHIESMLEQIGRKLMPGDVLEIPHLRDDLLLGQEGAINRFYVVQDGLRPSEGYDPNWWPHLWRVKVGPMTDSQEFRDILGTGENEDDLRNLLSNHSKNIEINEAIMAQANADWDPQWRAVAHLYIDENDTRDRPYPMSMGIASDYPESLNIVGQGITFPATGVNDGEYFLRTDFTPNRVFQKSGTKWIKVSDRARQPWAAANKVLTTFINNSTTTTNTDGTVTPERINMSKVVKPKTDI